MKFEDIPGCDELKERLVSMVLNDRLGHAVLLADEDGGNGLGIALALAQFINCRKKGENDSCGICAPCNKSTKLIHPDVHFVFPVSATPDLSEQDKKHPISDYFLDSFRKLASDNPNFTEQDLNEAMGVDKKSVSINVYESRTILEKLTLKAFEAETKIMVIYLPEKMNADAANKLLKILEEPPLGTLFLMISHAPEKLLNTIRSRCQIMQVPPMAAAAVRSKREMEVRSEFRDLAVRILKAGMSKRLIDTFEIWENIAEWGREKQKEFCRFFEEFIRKTYMVAGGLDSIARLESDEESIIRELAGRIKPSFYERAFTALENALSAIDNNVSAKLNFCDLCNRLLLSL